MDVLYIPWPSNTKTNTSLSNTKLKITLRPTNTILNKSRTIASNSFTKQQADIYQVRWQKCKSSHIALMGLHYNSDTHSTFAISRLTLHSHPMPTIILTIHINKYQLTLPCSIAIGANRHTHECSTKLLHSIFPT
jgi:hypothetical protein